MINNKKNIENSSYVMWYISDVVLEVDKIFEKLGCSKCKYYCSKDELCMNDHAFPYNESFCDEFQETK